jgi:hypothetical protein
MDWVIKTVMNKDFEKRVIVLNQETLVENVAVRKDKHKISRKFKQFFSTEKNLTGHSEYDCFVKEKESMRNFKKPQVCR